MKKITAFIICLLITFSPLYALNIEDSFVDETLDKNLKIKPRNSSLIVDEFAQNNNLKNPSKRIVELSEIIPDMPVNKFRKRPVIIDNDYKEIKIRIKNYYTTKNNLEEGDYLEFETLDTVKIKNKTYDKNSTLKARIETISKNKSYGVPSEVVISNFIIDNNVLAGEISKTGANRALWLYPLVNLTIPFFGLGLLFIPIRGGHAKIKQNETYTIYAIE